MITIQARVDDRHRIVAEAPESIPPGPVQLRLVVGETHDEDEAGRSWSAAVAAAWAAEWSDPREDIYDLSDGEPIDAAR